MRAFVRQPAAHSLDDEEWQAEKALWGIEDIDEPEDDTISLWEENWDVVAWWLSIPSFLKWNAKWCVGMDVMAVKADTELSGRVVDRDDYKKLKLIARTVAEVLNER